MPTPEEIKNLAREYAEYMCPVKDYEAPDDCSRCIDLDIYKDDFKSVLQWLSDRYCLVEKSKVKEKYALYKMGYTECEGLELGYVMDALEDIFGKSLFEEE